MENKKVDNPLPGMKRIVLYLILLAGFSGDVLGNTPLAVISGVVKDENGEPVIGASVALKETPYQTMTDAYGNYRLDKVPYGSFTIVAFYTGKKIIQQPIVVEKLAIELEFVLPEMSDVLDEVVVQSQRDMNELTRLNAVENFGIYEGKKTEVVSLKNLTVNTATNNARQLYGRITGLNIWESDGAGLQLGIGGRGLSPNRTANFNTRQNGYDISADALGYPESYYTPPAEALDQIEIVRGAASLQYGTQFGGLLNFKFKKGPGDRRIELTSRQSMGSWGFFGTFNSIGGTVAKGKLNYYSYYNYKQGNGYRPNSEFDFHNAYASLNYQVNPKLLVNVDVTKMNYLARQPGGLTDALFTRDPRMSQRERNWFKVDWNLFALNFTYKFSYLTELNIRNFGLIAERKALGVLEKTNVIDFGENRNLIDGQFKNAGSELRLLHRYEAFGRQHALVTGTRVYRGTSVAKQGFANNKRGPDFYFLNPEEVDDSDYDFLNKNYSFFVENIFDITPRLSITPGIRAEYISTNSDGFYKERVYDGAGNLVAETKHAEVRSNSRSFVIGGIGVSYKPTATTEFYGNFSQNYRAINFTDLRVVNPSLKTDLNLEDEKGFTADAGTRGVAGNFLTYEVTAFYINYQGKIGNMVDYDASGREFRFRDNIADAQNIGIEGFAELNITNLMRHKGESSLKWFVNTAVIRAKYVNSRDAKFRDKNVEMVPPLLVRTGATYRRKGFSSAVQFSYTAEHFSDASNARRTATAIEGVIPAYHVMDFSAAYDWKQFRIEASCNNVLNQQYFTRRADAYPGPGIIPAEGRGVYLTLQARVGR
jgi:Fe(3+) dicitrate transport protein